MEDLRRQRDEAQERAAHAERELLRLQTLLGLVKELLGRG
jgi:hypothetical protein